MTIYDFINNPTQDVKDFLKRNECDISSVELLKYFESLPEEARQFVLNEENGVVLEGHYFSLVENYVTDVLHKDLVEFIANKNKIMAAYF